MAIGEPLGARSEAGDCNPGGREEILFSALSFSLSRRLTAVRGEGVSTPCIIEVWLVFVRLYAASYVEVLERRRGPFSGAAKSRTSTSSCSNHCFLSPAVHGRVRGAINQSCSAYGTRDVTSAGRSDEKGTRY